MPLPPLKTLGGRQPPKFGQTQKRPQAGKQTHGGKTPAPAVHYPKGMYGDQGSTADHVDTCARVLAVSARRTRFWFHHSVRMTLYAVHRARQRILLGTLSSLRRLATRALRHMDVLELALRSALAHTATVARANISHQPEVPHMGCYGDP